MTRDNERTLDGARKIADWQNSKKVEISDFSHFDKKQYERNIEVD